MDKISNIKTYVIEDENTLRRIESEFRKDFNNDITPCGKGTSFVELATFVFPDRAGTWKTKLYYERTTHKSSTGMANLCLMASEYLNNLAELFPIDILSISAEMENGKIILSCLVRPYTETFTFDGFFDYVGEYAEEEIVEEKVVSGQLVIPDEIKNFSISEEDRKAHTERFKKQGEAFRSATKETPFLNQLDHYEPKKIRTPEDYTDLVYDLQTSDRRIKIISSYEHFIEIFNEIMTYVNGVEYYDYVNVLYGEDTEEHFMSELRAYVEKYYVQTQRFNEEDMPELMKKLERSLFKLYIVQDLVDDPNVTDIKITAPDAIRARVKGKAYMSNIHFIDRADYLRFINMIAIRNKISQNVPEQTFTDTNDPNYIIRFSITAEYVNSVEWPYLHIRKIDRKKLLSDELIKAGMFDEKIRDYLLDCGQNSRGVVFCGPPGSGKTVCLNWFLEDAYEQSAEILVIQENDELFCYRKGVMFQHVVNYAGDNQEPVTLEDLGKLALVAGANVFIIGEAKGAEICSAITLSNSGCRTAITIHSNSSTDTIDKMADLAMRGYATDYTQAKRMLRSFQTIVYLEDFKIREISEITGFDEEKQDMTYRYIYRDPNWKKRGN